MHAIFQLIYFEPSAKEDLSEQTIIMLHNLKSIKSHAHHLHVSTWKYAHNPLCPPFVSILTNFLPQAWMSINVHSSVLCFLLGKLIYPSSIEHLSPWTLLWTTSYFGFLCFAFFPPSISRKLGTNSTQKSDSTHCSVFEHVLCKRAAPFPSNVGSCLYLVIFIILRVL